jgi:hypothetical protein
VSRGNQGMLHHHFEHVSQSKATPEAVGRATFLAQKRKNNKVLTFMFFMDDLLKIVSNLSLQFQKEIQQLFLILSVLWESNGNVYRFSLTYPVQ